VAVQKNVVLILEQEFIETKYAVEQGLSGIRIEKNPEKMKQTTKDKSE
jgi:hypothetical protein